MKILMLLERDFPPDLRVENEIKSSINAGHSVVLACFTQKKQTTEFDWNGCKIYKRKISNFYYKSSVAALRFPFYFNFWRKFIKEIIKKESPDAIHIHDLPLAKIGFECKQNYSMKFILDLHENWPAYLRMSTHANSFLGRLLSSNKQWVSYEKKHTNNADRVIVVVDEAKERLNTFLKNDDNCRVVSNTINLDETLPETKDNNTKDIILFYGGGINYHRGLQSVINAFPAILSKNKNVHLWIVGDGSYKQDLENLTTSLDLNNNVKFYGFKPYNNMLEILADSTIALIPHLISDHTNSTIPHKLFQYMYFKKPIITSSCKPLKRILDDTKTGFSYNPDSPEEFASIVLDMTKDISSLKILGENGKRSVENNYNWGIDSKILLSIYDELN